MPERRSPVSHRCRAALLALCAALCGCAAQPPAATADAPSTIPCRWPTAPSVRLERDGLVLKVWTFAERAVFASAALPADAAYAAYRARLDAAGAIVRQPALVVPPLSEQSQPDVWRDETLNNAAVYRGDVGTLQPITCLDALLFAEQNARFPQLETPTEFLASVLRRTTAEVTELTVVFGAGAELFPPKAVYGLDVVQEYRAQGWQFWYMIHNHTLQRDGDAVVLGVPAPSSSDVRFARSLADSHGLQRVRVTNGFYTFDAAVSDLASLRAR
ncbi:MAG: hypothetical protein AAGD86_00040 [Pseudomonadota bacterium]